MICGFCQKECELLKCSRCKEVYYCDVVCQKADWKEHKKSCEGPPKSLPSEITIECFDDF